MTGAGISEVLRERASRDPDRVFLRTSAGDLTLAEMDTAVDRVASGLQRRGLRPGSVLAVFLPNRAETVITIFAAARAGLLVAPVNTAFRGDGLAHALNVTRASMVVVDAELLPAIEDVAPRLEALRTAAVVGAVPSAGPFAMLAFADLHARSDTRPETVSRAPTDPAVLLFTSGSTGRSKACQISHRYLVRHAEVFVEQLGLQAEDVLYCPYPLFHIDAVALTVMPALLTGAVAAIGERFSVSRFWDEVRAFDATVFDFMGATLTMLHQSPPTDRDRDHRVRLAWGVPMPAFTAAFEERFGIRLIELYGSTDAGVVLYPADPPVPGSCGRTIGTYDVEVHDADGQPVPSGTTGQLVLRPRERCLLADGYFGEPEATLASRQDLWFHTGDLVRCDADGNVFFVGRRDDVVRRRGENIAVAEVEEVLSRHPAVLEVVVFGVASELTEQDVKAAVVVRPDSAVTPLELWEFCHGRMARHMVPRFIELVASIPRTPTEKVERHVLSTAGVTPATWDSLKPGSP